MPSRLKRFIAGASCPACKTLDTIHLFYEASLPIYECVRCGYVEKMTPAQANPAQVDEQVLNFVNPPKK